MLILPLLGALLVLLENDSYINKEYLDHTYPHLLKLFLDPQSSLRAAPKTLPDALGLVHTLT